MYRGGRGARAGDRRDRLQFDGGSHIADPARSESRRRRGVGHDKRNLGRAGKSSYVIDFAQQGANTVVTTRNRTMTPEQAAKMQFDINRWKSGQKNCSKEWPKVAAQPAG